MYLVKDLWLCLAKDEWLYSTKDERLYFVLKKKSKSSLLCDISTKMRLHYIFESYLSYTNYGELLISIVHRVGMGLEVKFMRKGLDI